MACRTCDMIRGILMAQGMSESVADATVGLAEKSIVKAEKKVKRKASAYAKRYGRAFKSVSKRYKTKAGGWKKNGFRLAQKAAHKIAKGGR